MQAKSLINISAGLPPQEVFVNDGAFVAHSGLDEHYEYYYIVRAGATVTLPLNNEFPLIITCVYWYVPNSGMTLIAPVTSEGLEAWLFDTALSSGVEIPKPLIIGARGNIRIVNKDNTNPLRLLIQAKRTSLNTYPTVNV